MRKCPYCEAEIEENARICLYCMKELQPQAYQKVTLFGVRRRVLLICCAVFVLALLFFFIWRGVGHKPESVPAKTEDSATSQTQPSVTEPSSAQTQKSETEQSVSSESNGTAQSGVQTGGKGSNGGAASVTGSGASSPSGSSSSSQQGGTTTPSKPTPVTDTPDQSDPVTKPDQQVQTPEKEPKVEQTPPVKNEPESDPPATPAVTEAVYTYRDAKYAVDDYLVTANVDNCVVITGVSTPASDGIYHLPSTLGGKKVIAVDSWAFNGASVRAVYVPASIRTIKSYAFMGCTNLSDIYFYGNAIYVDTQAFSPKAQRSATLTIHCSQNCSNRDLRYYRNIAAEYYDAVYEEWNG